MSAYQALEDYTNVTAPIAGVVIWRYADTGALIQGGTNSNDQALPIVRLSQSTLLRLRVPVPEDDVQYVHEGDLLEVRVDAINRSFTGKIVRFTRDVNFETRTMETEVDVENKNLSIAPGMYANTAAAAGQREERGDHSCGGVGSELATPAGRSMRSTAAITCTSATSRWVWRGQSWRRSPSGLNPGDRVLIGGQEKYQEDEQVSPILPRRLLLRPCRNRAA